MRRVDSFFFDLDGTLCDSRPGLAYSFIAAFNALGVHDTEDLDVDRFLGTPLPEALRVVVTSISDRGIKRGIRAFRQAYEQQGIFRAPLYDGARDVLTALARSPAKVWLVTSKPTKYATMVLDNLRIADKFDGVVGAGLAESDTKTELLQRALRRSHADPDHAVMLGDRFYDVAAALACGVTPVGALWGYANRKELRDAGCRLFCKSLAEFKSAYVEPSLASFGAVEYR